MAELGSGNGTDYPSALDTDNTLEVDGSTLVRADVPNDMGAAIVAIENELGTNPSGTAADVKTYLQVEHNTNGTHDTTKVVMIAGAQTITGEKLFSETLRLTKGTDVASAGTITLGAGNYFDITGTTTITGITSIGAGTWVKLHFDGALTLTHHATDFVLPTGADITTVAGDEAEFVEYATGDWRMVSYTPSNRIIIANSIGPSLLSKTSSELSQAILLGTTWVPAAGTWILGWYNSTGASTITSQIQLNSTWHDIDTDVGGPLMCDGTNMRFNNGTGVSATIYYRKLA